MDGKKKSKILESNLWRELKQGDRTAFNSIIRSHYQLLFNYGCKISKDQSLVEDCIQELFIYLWEHRDTLADVNVVRAYLIKSLRRRVINQLSTKDQKLVDRVENFAAETKGNFFSFSHEKFLIDNENNKAVQEKLKAAISNLPDRQREAIYLKYYSGLSYEEIAQVMDMEKQSVANVLRRALLSLRTLFSLFVPMVFRYLNQTQA
ncbi:RNA polymerase sigma factor [Reichenbachiella sp.]|uniref:RNA polymerase sigma factor n=1 Tax=Reichenbachiella sp. TaxID=2184521 RepID=UPI003BB03121